MMMMMMVMMTMTIMIIITSIVCVACGTFECGICQDDSLQHQCSPRQSAWTLVSTSASLATPSPRQQAPNDAPALLRRTVPCAPSGTKT
eukprot:11635956-Karenia_brevis.AAC.1